MANSRSRGDSTEPPSLIYILPDRFQRKRLEDIKQSLSKKKLPYSEILTENVTHIVTEYDSEDQVHRQLLKTGKANVLLANVSIVRFVWLSKCLKAATILPLHSSDQVAQKEKLTFESNFSLKQPCCIAEWACQRPARRNHFNKKLTVALETLQEHAELRDDAQDYSRALAFRRASCVLKSFPSTLQDVQELDGVKDIGGHVKRVVADILESGYSSEVDSILKSEWFLKMKLFTSVFGVGPATAKKWIEKGWNSLKDVSKADNYGSDWRIAWGLAFHKDLNHPVFQNEAYGFVHAVKAEAENILPGVIVTLAGGFRRGKPNGHDVDILLSHPVEGKEMDLLPRLLLALDKKGFVLIGHKEKNSYRPDVLYQDYKLSMRGQLDHFEKWIGICKFPNTFQKLQTQTISNSQSEQERPLSNQDTLGTPEISTKPICSENDLAHIFVKGENLDEHNLQVTNKLRVTNDSLEDDVCEPQIKKKKLHNETGLQPTEIAEADRDWLARRVDLIVTPYSQYYYALFGWTGSKHFNRDVRLYAQKVLGYKFTSHGLYSMAKQKSLCATSEEDIFQHLNIPCRPPSERNC